MHNNPFNDDTFRNAHLLGIDPQLPFYDLNLAGAQGTPTVNTIASAAMPPTSNAPTFTGPDMNVPTLAPYDLTEPGITLHSVLAVDPLLPDLSDYAHPNGLDIHAGLATLNDSTQSAHLTDEAVDGLNPLQDIWQSDPLLPDLHHPELTQQTHMPERPADLAPDALPTMHMSATYQQLTTKTYPTVYMDASGNNTMRSRHMDLLMRGLDEEEQ